MSKPYTESDLGSQINEDRTWRIRELSDLKTAIVRADPVSQKVLLRALIAICYAHWEGHVKFAAVKYLEHVALRRLLLGELERQFTRNHFLRRLAGMASSKASLAERCAIVDQILDSRVLRFARVEEELVSTRGNLSYEVLAEICSVCGVPPKQFEEHQSFIDLMLLKRRNSIAHGEDTFVAVADLGTIVENTVALMRMFGDAIENRVYLKSYRVA